MSYGGFYIEDKVGNNEFSYDERKNKSIFVPELIKSGFDGIEFGELPNFIEVEDGEEKVCIGLKNMYELIDDSLIDNKTGKMKRVYLFDNHNHAFYFWCKALGEGIFKRGTTLVHVDQHKDTREPKNYDVNTENIEDVKRYTNEVLNVGSFIKPAMEKGIFSDLDIIDSTYSLNKEIPKDYVLDLDLDFFSKDMDYIDDNLKFSKVKKYIEGANLITIATSPYFIEQDRAVDALKKLFWR